VLQVSDGYLPNIFELENQAEKVSVIGKVMRFVGLQDEEKKEEEKKEDFNDKMSRFKKFDLNLDFKPQEIIRFYVQPSEFLKTKFNEQWTQITDIEIKRAKDKYAEKIKQINLNF